jgi:hypothetical protein
MQTSVALVAALVATWFAVEIGRDAVRHPRPHVTSYAIGVASFALATWALFVGIAFGWGEASYKVFFLFGAILNVPFLALGSAFLVAPGFAKPMLGLVVPFSFFATLVILPQKLRVTEFVAGEIPDRAATFLYGTLPRVLAIISGAAASTILVVLALVSIIRFRKKARNVVTGSALIVVGTFAAAAGGTLLGLGLGQAGFSLSLLVAVVLIYFGYRTASGSRSRGPGPEPDDAAPR